MWSDSFCEFFLVASYHALGRKLNTDTISLESWPCHLDVTTKCHLKQKWCWRHNR